MPKLTHGNLFHAQAVDAARRSGSRDLIKTATLNMVKALATEGMQAETASATSIVWSLVTQSCESDTKPSRERGRHPEACYGSRQLDGERDFWQGGSQTRGPPPHCIYWRGD